MCLKLLQVNGSPTSLITMHLPKTVHVHLNYLPQKITIQLEGKKKGAGIWLCGNSKSFEAHFSYLQRRDENIKW